MNNLDTPFAITSVSRADLETIGFDASNVDDATMERLAGKLADDFWSSLEILAREYFDIPRRPDFRKD